VAGVAATLAGAAAVVFSAASDQGWASFGGGADNARYVTAKEITKANVAKMAVAWSYAFADTSFNPVVEHGVVYGRGRNASLVALDAKTGREIWIHERMQGMTTRGMNYWESRDGKDRRLIFSVGDYLQEIDARTGKSILTFGTAGAVDLREGLGRQPDTVARIQSGTPGEIFENLIVLGSATGEGYMSPPGDIRAYDVLTGALVWQFHTVPHPGEFGYETWPKDAYKYSGGTNTWGELSIDTKRGIVYVPTGSPTYDYYGADRPGANLFANCLLALDVRTGKRLWHFQNVHHDLWDFDNNAAPQLTTIKRNGRSVDVVAMAGKTGFLYVFNRETGDPIWPIEERPVPKSTMPGEQSWPTQPYPTVVPPFARQAFTLDDINPYPSITDEQRQAFKERVRTARNEGIFTPIDFTDTIHIPGSNGGALFGTTAADPNGIVYVINQDNPGLLRLLKPGEGRAGGPAGGALPGAPIFQRECAQCHGADRSGTADGPSLLQSAGARLDPVTIRTNVINGYGRMDPVQHITPDELELVVQFLTAPPPGAGFAGRGAGPRGAGPEVPAELIVGSGPSVARPPAARGRGAGPAPYPEGVENTPRYVINEYGTIGVRMKPPFTTLVKYDLNVPAIKWRVGVGDDPVLAAYGITGTGMTQMRTSPIVTATGLIFIPGGDNKVRAYDADTGRVLWTGRFGGSLVKAAASMYEVDGHQYLLVPAASEAPPAMRPAPGAPAPEPVSGPVGYVAYALPK
jgi:quinoprotein glucose dehydrogenase